MTASETMPLLGRFGEQSLHRRSASRPASALDISISTYQGAGASSGARVSGICFEHEIEREAAHELERREASVPARLRPGGTARATRDVRQRRQRDRRLGRPRKQLQRRRSDDAERAFRADEQIAQVVAGVVLLQGAQPSHTRPVGGHHLEPERQRARVAVGQHADAAGVGRQHAADLAAAFRRQAQRESRPAPSAAACARPASRPPRRSSCRLRRRPRAPAFSRDSDSTTWRRRGRYLAADEAGVAALRDDADTASCAMARICATSRVEPGRSTSAALPAYSPRSSRRYGNCRSLSAMACAGPTTSAMRAERCAPGSATIICPPSALIAGHRCSSSGVLLTTRFARKQKAVQMRVGQLSRQNPNRPERSSVDRPIQFAGHPMRTSDCDALRSALISLAASYGIVSFWPHVSSARARRQPRRRR